MDIVELIYEGILEKLLKIQMNGNMPTMLVSAGNREDNPPRLMAPQIREVTLVSTKQEIQTNRMVSLRENTL